MSAFRDEETFPIEISIRSQLNYYTMLEYEIEKSDDNEQKKEEKLHEISLKRNRLKEVMKYRGFTPVRYCCGTQLINSMIGLLILPQQKYYTVLAERENPDPVSFAQQLPTLFSLTRGSLSGNYINTYHENPFLISNILRHLRNSVAHDQLGVKPKNYGDSTQVTNIIFRDEDKRKYHVFELNVPVEHLENMLIEISDLFIRL